MHVLLRRFWLIGAIMLVIAGAWLALRTQRVDPRDCNLLFITLDTTRADVLGCYGAASARTPSLDRLAQRGVRFANCLTCVSLTAPSHCSLMTSTYPFVHGVRRNGASRLPQAATTLAETLQAAGWKTQASVASFVLDRTFGLDQGFDAYRDVPAGEAAIAIHAERAGDQIANEGIAALRELRGGKFFLWLHFYDPHFPYAGVAPGDSPAAGYADEVRFMDEQIGRVLAELRRLDLDRRTVVVVVGDHGEAFGEHGEFQHGYFAYQTTLHVPLIVAGPGVDGGGRAPTNWVRTIDVAPTVLALLGQDKPAAFAGRSLTGLWNGGQDSDPPAYAETIEAHDQFGLAPLAVMVHDGAKYIHAPTPELFDLATDPAEANNLWPAQRERADEMRAALHELLEKSPAAIPQDAGMKLSAQDLARLNALGYVGNSSQHAASVLQSFDAAPLGDPKDFAQTLRQYGESHWAMVQGQFALAEQLLAPVVAAVPGAVRPRADLAFAQQSQGHTADAERTYLAAIGASPQDGYVRRMYAGLLLSTRRWKDAEEQLLFALADRPDDVEARYDLAVALAETGRLADARAELARALEVDPRYINALHAMGAFYGREGRIDEAIEYFQRVLAIDPNHARAQHDLQAAQAARSNP
jgi:arylsulfatase A-like enzyme/Flp pilus assembly protein TadD